MAGTERDERLSSRLQRWRAVWVRATVLARERVVLLSTHIPEDIAAACRRVLVLAARQVRFDGTVDELLAGASGSVRQRTVLDRELRDLARDHRIVSRVRKVQGVCIRYLSTPHHKYAGIRAPLHPTYRRFAPSTYARGTRRSRNTSRWAHRRPRCVTVLTARSTQR